MPLLDSDDFYPSLPHLPHPIRHSTNGIRQIDPLFLRGIWYKIILAVCPLNLTFSSLFLHFFKKHVLGIICYCNIVEKGV